jgi:hypothetical protein
MKRTILALATILALNSATMAQDYEYPGPPMYPRDPCAYGPGPDCPGHRHPEYVPMPRERPQFGPPMPDCILNGTCRRHRRDEGPYPMPPYPEYEG